MSFFTNKIAVITGAANGLGKALAIVLRKQGCHLALLDIDKSGLEKLRSELGDDAHKISIHIVDVSKETEVIAAAEEIIRANQRIDILINNAGVSISQPFTDISIGDYKWLMDINFWGTVYCCKYFLPALQRSADGRLVNIISDFAYMGFPGKTAYGSSKSAVMGFTNSLRTEAEGTELKISLVVPPPLFTDIVRNGKHVNDVKKNSEEAFLKRNSMPLDKAASKITAGIVNGRYRIIVGPVMFWVDIAARISPAILHWFVARNKDKFDFV